MSSNDLGAADFFAKMSWDIFRTCPEHVLCQKMSLNFARGRDRPLPTKPNWFKYLQLTVSYFYDSCIFIYIDQCQNQLHLTNEWVIPNKVTRNPTDDTASMMSYWVVLHLIIILLTMVQIVFRIKTVIIIIILHFLQVVLNILPTMTIYHIQYNIDSTTVQHCPLPPTIIFNNKNKCTRGSLQPLCVSPVPFCKCIYNSLFSPPSWTVITK